MPPNRTHLTIALVVGTVLGLLTIALGAGARSEPPRPAQALVRSGGGDGSGGGHGDGSGGGHGRHNKDGGADDGGASGR